MRAARFPGFVYQLGNLIASVNATLQAGIAAHYGGDYGFALAAGRRHCCGRDRDPDGARHRSERAWRSASAEGQTRSKVRGVIGLTPISREQINMRVDRAPGRDG